MVLLSCIYRDEKLETACSLGLAISMDSCMQGAVFKLKPLLVLRDITVH